MGTKSNSCILKTTKYALLSCMFFIPTFPSYGHLYGLNFQEWTDKENNFLIQFDTDPHTITAGETSLMLFSVQDLQTRQHFKNFTETITITNSDSSPYSGIIHKFGSKKINDGDFSQEYSFPNGGTYQILVRIDTAKFISIASFTIFVSSPTFQILNLIYVLLPIMIFIGIIVGVGIIIMHYIYKK
jgi:hypothetical protein